MTALCKVVVVCYVLALSVSSTFGQQCNGGVECILLDDCTGLYNQLLKNGNTPELRQLLRGLHCGFDGQKPKFINTRLESRMKSAQGVQQPKTKKKQKVTHHDRQPNIFDLGFWGFTTVKPRTMLNHHKTGSPTAKPKRTPITKQIKQPRTVNTRVNPTMKSSIRPAGKSIIKPTPKPPLMKPATVKPIIRPTVQSIRKATLKPIVTSAVKPKTKPAIQISKGSVVSSSIKPATVKPITRPTVQSIRKATMKPIVKSTTKPKSKPGVQISKGPVVPSSMKPATVKPMTRPTVQSIRKVTIKPITTKPLTQPPKKLSAPLLIKPATMKPILRPTVQSIKKATVKPIATSLIIPQMKPTAKPIIRPTAQFKIKPTVQPIVNTGLQHTIKPKLRPTKTTTEKPTVKSLIRHTVKPALNQAAKPIVHTAVNHKTPDRQKICCPPQFQGTQSDVSSSSASSWSGNTNGGGESWNRGGPSTNSNSANGWNGGSTNTNSNGANNGNGGSFNTNSNSGANRGETPSDPTSLLPNTRVCGNQNNDRIVGGTRADIDEHPWMALLRYDKPVGWGFYCGGVLISSRYVLTAAHCVKGQDLPTNWRLSQVRLGEWNTSSVQDCVMDDCATPVQDVMVEETIPHEQYDPQDSNQHNDIALLRLAKAVQFTDFVSPICLPLTKELKNNGFDGFNMEVAGWGKTETRSESDVKLKVSVPVVSKSQCEAVFSRVNRVITNKQLCAGGTPGRDSCRGDSGGALMGRVPSAVNWYAVGVVSYGPSPCGTPGWPGVYTRVGAYVDWILSKIRP